MPTLIIALDGRELQRLPLTRPRTTVGRRPYNDIVMEHLAVSGEHAVFVLQPDGRVQVLDLNSTNGTYVNGRAVVSADVGPDDLIEIARYQLRVVDDATPALATATATATPPPTVAQRARLEVLDGPAAGRTVALTKAATTIGKPGVAVATVTHRGTDYVLTQAAGERPATLNGQAIGPAGATLHDGDVIALAGTRIRFVLC